MVLSEGHRRAVGGPGPVRMRQAFAVTSPRRCRSSPRSRSLRARDGRRRCSCPGDAVAKLHAISKPTCPVMFDGRSGRLNHGARSRLVISSALFAVPAGHGRVDHEPAARCRQFDVRSRSVSIAASGPLSVVSNRVDRNVRERRQQPRHS